MKNLTFFTISAILAVLILNFFFASLSIRSLDDLYDILGVDKISVFRVLFYFLIFALFVF